MKPMMSRRELPTMAPAFGLAYALPRRAAAMDRSSAKILVANVVSDLEGIVNSGASERAMYPMLLKLFGEYADVGIIARATLGVAARSATRRQLQAYSTAFEAYLVAKYTRRFRDFIGARIVIQSVNGHGDFWTVDTSATLRAQPPFSLLWQVSSKAGKPLFFNVVIDCVDMLALERSAIGSMLDSHHGDIAALTTDLRTRTAL